MDPVPATIPTRADIERLQAAVSRLPQGDYPTTHHFPDGLYVRTMHVPAGHLIVGAIHRFEHAFILQRGEMLLTGDGMPARLVVGPLYMAAQPGVKRAGFAQTDCVVTDIFVTDCQDVAELERTLIEPDPLGLLNGVKPMKALP